QEAIAIDSFFISQRFKISFAQRQRGIFNGMMLVDVQVTVDVDVQISSPMSSQLFQHMIKKSQAGVYVALSGPVQIQADLDLGFGSVSFYTRFPCRQPEEFINFIP